MPSNSKVVSSFSSTEYSLKPVVGTPPESIRGYHAIVTDAVVSDVWADETLYGAVGFPGKDWAKCCAISLGLPSRIRLTAEIWNE